MQLLRVAYLSDSDIPSKRANTVHVVKMCSALQGMGADVTLFCNQKDTFNEEEIFNSYCVKNKFGFQAIQAKRKGKLQIPEYAVKKARLVRKGNYDCCYGRSLLALFFLRKDFPFIYESHIKPNRWLYKMLERKVLKSKKLKKLVVISNNLKTEYLKLFPFLKPSDILVLHDGADKAEADSYTAGKVPAALLTAHEKGVTIGYIGHLYPGKCMEVLIPLAKECHERTFFVVGGTEEWIAYWQAKCREEGISNIVFCGFVENSCVNACYHHIDIVLLPFSKEIFYNKDKKDDIGKWISPLKLFEAMSNGKAIISSDLPSIREVIEDEVDGFLVGPDDLTAWKETIDRLVADDSLRNGIGDHAKSKFEQEYTWDKRAERILEAFRGY